MGSYTIDYGTRGPKLVAAFAQAYNYQDEIRDETGAMIPNPETKVAFAKRKVQEYIQAIADAYVDPTVQVAQDALDSAKAASALENEDITVA